MLAMILGGANIVLFTPFQLWNIHIHITLKSFYYYIS